MKKFIKFVFFLVLVNYSQTAAQSLISLNTANYNSPDVSFHNPAAISYFKDYHVMVSTQFLHTGLENESMQNSLLSFVYPLDQSSALGARVNYFTSNIFQQGDFSLLYSRRFIDDFLTVGLNLNLLYYGYNTDEFFLFDMNDPLLDKGTSQNAFSFGLSVLSRPADKLLMGLSVDHLNSPDISLSQDGFEKDKVISIGLTYLNSVFVPQLDMRIEGEDVITQTAFSKELYNKKLNLKTGYNFHNDDGSGFFVEMDFMIGDLGIMYSLNNQLGTVADVAGMSHQIGLFYTKGKRGSIPDIILSNIGYDSHLPELELIGKVVCETGLDYIEIKNNDQVQERIKCENNTISQDIMKTINLIPGENEILVSAASADVTQRERILVDFDPLPSQIEVTSIQNTQVDNEKYELNVDVSDRTGLEKILVVLNDELIKSYTSVKTNEEKIKLPVILQAGENKFRIIATNRWKKAEVASFVTYKSSELPPVLTIDSPQQPISTSSSIIVNLELENKKYIDEIVIKINGEQTEIIKLKPTTRGVKKIESAIPVVYDPLLTGSTSRTVELKSTESVIEAIAYDSAGLPRTSSKVLKVLYNPYEHLLRYQKKIAIIIGIDKYESEKISRLDLAVSDAETVKGLLNDYYKFDEIYTLYNKDATFRGISREIYGKLKNAGPQDLIVIYYAGHGNTIEDQVGGEAGYLLPYDTDLETDLNTISMTNLNQKAIQSKAKDILFIIDACYSGLGLVSVPPLSQYPAEDIDYEKLKNEKNKMSRNIITAGGKKQEAVDGLFTRFLKNGLMGAADYNGDNYITSNELGYYLKANVSKEAKKYNMEQTPQFGSIISDRGELIFKKNQEK